MTLGITALNAKSRTMLLAGGSYADIPMIKAAQALGYRVVTSGNRPQDLGHRFADDTQLADFSDRNAILVLARELGVEAICASCNDFSALSCAWAAEQLGLPGHDAFETCRTLHHKDLYRAFALANDIASPQAIGCGSVEDGRLAAANLGFPVIVKPVDLTGGKGIRVVESLVDLDAALENAFALTRAGRVVVEEFVEGSRHGFTCIIKDRKVIFRFLDNEHYFLNPYMVSAASAPADLPDATGLLLTDEVECIADLLQLVDGIVHVQFIASVHGPVIIEICRRPPGDLYVLLVQHATGVDYPSLIVRPACGLSFGDVRQIETRGFYGRHCVMSRKTGVVTELIVDPVVVTKVIDQMLWWNPGDVIDDSLVQKLGIMFFRFGDAAEMRVFMEQMQDLVQPVFAD